jgi:hypothetical protein
MENISTGSAWLLITTLIYFIMNGAGIYETLVIIPKWTASPPESLQVFKEPYGINLKKFWIGMHSIHELTFILAIIFCWSLTPIRNWLLIFFIIHFLTRVWTILYFAPNVIEFQKIANSSDPPAGLISKATMWRKLNYIRTGISILVSLGFIPLCIEILCSKLK